MPHDDEQARTLSFGPELLYGGFASASSTAAGSGGSASAGTFFSLAMRLGLALGSTTPEHKKRFTLGLDMHVVFAPDNVTVMPMIALGYDKQPRRTLSRLFLSR